MKINIYYPYLFSTMEDDDALCDFCRKPGAVLKCSNCRQRACCNKKCQKKHWKAQSSSHKAECKSLREAKKVSVLVSEDLGGRRAAASPQPAHRHRSVLPSVEGGAAGCGGSGGSGGGSGKHDAEDDVTDNDEPEPVHPCPICFENEDDGIADGEIYGCCHTCGVMFCGPCHRKVFQTTKKCPTCRTDGNSVTLRAIFQGLWALIHTRSPGRHTPAAQVSLGSMFYHGDGVPKDHVQATKWYRLAAESGSAHGQHNYADMHWSGLGGLPVNHEEGERWELKSAAQGYPDAQYSLGSHMRCTRGCSCHRCTVTDGPESVKWLTLAANQNHTRALLRL